MPMPLPDTKPNQPEIPQGPTHEGGWTATQSLVFFRAHGIRGRLLSTRRNGKELREYVCRTRYLDGSVADFGHRILATPGSHST